MEVIGGRQRDSERVMALTAYTGLLSRISQHIMFNTHFTSLPCAQTP
jgi:hypothetical protein